MNASRMHGVVCLKMRRVPEAASVQVRRNEISAFSYGIGEFLYPVDVL